MSFYQAFADEEELPRLIDWCAKGHVTPDLNHPMRDGWKVERGNFIFTPSEEAVITEILL
jgi:hypothetical protein